MRKKIEREALCIYEGPMLVGGIVKQTEKNCWSLFASGSVPCVKDMPGDEMGIRLAALHIINSLSQTTYLITDFKKCPTPEWVINMISAEIGDVVWYVVQNTREQAEIIGLNCKTHATIRLLTGPQAGRQLEAPWGIIQPL